MGAPICPSCNKFCSLEMQEPESNDIDLSDNREDADDEIEITYSIRIVRNSECCGDEIKEANFDGSISVKVEGHYGDDHTLSLNEDSLESDETGGGRYKKSYYGFTAEVSIECSCGEDVAVLECSGDGSADWEENRISFSDNIAASEMDDLV